MKTYWQYKFPGNIYFGENSLNELKSIYSNFEEKTTLVITDPGIVNSGVWSTVEEKLKEFSIPYKLFDGAKPEPTKSDVNSVIAEFKNEEFQVIIGLGGGSSLDLAKMVSLLMRTSQPLDYYYNNPIPGNLIPTIAIPTTAGTGSEVTGVAVVNDQELNLKVGLSSDFLKPEYAILEPKLTIGMPPRVTATAGIDALVHAVEAFTAKNYTDFEDDYTGDFRGATLISDLFAKEAIQLIINNLKTAVKDGGNFEARSNMLLGSLLAGLAFSNAGTSLSHAMAYAIAGRSHSPHGEITGLMLPYAVQSNYEYNEEKFNELARICLNGNREMDQKDALNQFFIELLESINLPTQLREIKISENQLEEMAKETLGIARLMNINPRKMNETDLVDIYKIAF